MDTIVYIEKHHNDVARIKNSLGRNIQAGEFVVLGKLSGVVDRDTKDGEMFGLQMEPFLEIQVALEDLDPAGSYPEGGELYFSQPTGTFADSADSGLFAVGQIAHNRIDESGIITFFKYPLAVEAGV